MVRFLWEKQAGSLSSEYERTDRNIKLKENPTGFCCLLPRFELKLDEQIWNSVDVGCLTGEDRRLVYTWEFGEEMESQASTGYGLLSYQNPKQ